MPASKNELKAKLASGQRCVGCWLALADAYSAEIAASTGFDWLLIDGEHAPNDFRSILRQLQVMGQSAPVVRLPDGDQTKIKQALDLGAQTLLIPVVESAEQASGLVDAVRYPPVGKRGVGAALARASGFGSIKDYVATADAQICLIVQVETRKGLTALDDILAVEGVDGVFIGPADLAADMGLNPTDEKAKASVMDAISRIAASEKFAGVFSNSQPYLRDADAAGATFLGVGADVTILAEGLRERAASWR